MNKLTNKVLFALAVAGILTFATTYVPMLSAVANACGSIGAGC